MLFFAGLFDLVFAVLVFTVMVFLGQYPPAGPGDALAISHLAPVAVVEHKHGTHHHDKHRRVHAHLGVLAHDVRHFRSPAPITCMSGARVGTLP